MSRGHVTGDKQEKQGSQDWYKAIEAEALKQIDAAWAAAQVQQASK